MGDYAAAAQDVDMYIRQGSSISVALKLAAEDWDLDLNHLTDLYLEAITNIVRRYLLA